MSNAKYHHGDLRESLLQCARKIIEEQGVEAVSLRGVARAAGVSQAAPYHHFADKKALLAAVAARGFIELTKWTMESVEGIDRVETPKLRLDAMGAAYVQFALANPSLFRLMQGPELQGDSVTPDLYEARDASAAPLIEGVADCLPGANEGQIMNGCAAAWSMVHGIAMLVIDGRLPTLLDVGDGKSLTDSITRLLDLQPIIDGAAH